MQGFSYWRDAGSPLTPKFALLPTRKNSPCNRLLLPHQIYNTIKTSFLIIAPVTFLFWTSYSLYTQVLLILILIYVQYLQNVVFSSEKYLNGQSHSKSYFHHSVKNLPQQNLPSFPNGGHTLIENISLAIS